MPGRVYAMGINPGRPDTGFPEKATLRPKLAGEQGLRVGTAKFQGPSVGST